MQIRTIAAWLDVGGATVGRPKKTKHNFYKFHFNDIHFDITSWCNQMSSRSRHGSTLRWAILRQPFIFSAFQIMAVRAFRNSFALATTSHPFTLFYPSTKINCLVIISFSFAGGAGVLAPSSASLLIRDFQCVYSASLACSFHCGTAITQLLAILCNLHIEKERFLRYNCGFIEFEIQLIC